MFQGELKIFSLGMQRRELIELIAPGKCPGLSGLNFTLGGEDEEVQMEIHHGLEMDGGDGCTTVGMY